MDKLKSQPKKKDKMKTNIIILISLIALNTSLTMANKSSVTFFENPVEIRINSEFANLAPVTPQEASFNDLVPEPIADFSSLAPITPKEADFEDEMKDGTVICKDLLKSLAPTAPKEAEFENNSSPELLIVTGN
jgi:hypothetical protein